MIGFSLKWQGQPSGKSCGQTCVAMICGIPVADVIAAIGSKGTVARELVGYLRSKGFLTSDRCIVLRKMSTDWTASWVGLPSIAICRVRWGDPTSRRAHWCLWAEGRWFDPLHPGAPMHIRRPNGRVLSYVEVQRP